MVHFFSKETDALTLLRFVHGTKDPSIPQEVLHDVFVVYLAHVT